MSFIDAFGKSLPPIEQGPTNPWWLDCLVGDSAMAALQAFADGLVVRHKRVDDTMATTMHSFVSVWSKHFNVPVPRLFLHRATGQVWVGAVNEDGYRAMVGEWPSDDDLHRINCETPGTVGHAFCGWCRVCERPRFKCGHFQLTLPAT